MPMAPDPERGRSMNLSIKVEICVGDVESAIAAEAGGADRVELCDNLSVGGTTPSAGVIAETCRWVSIPVHVLIRPRAGDFVYSDRELAAMAHDIEAAKALGASGVVLGVLTDEGTVDADRTAELIRVARPMTVTFHKAIDQTRQTSEALDTLIALGIDRVLTSGARASALEGLDRLAQMVSQSAGRITIMAGGRLASDHITTILDRARVREIHLGSAVTKRVRRPGIHEPEDGSDLGWNRADALHVREIVTLVEKWSTALNVD
jgi:copper homeostasis protein